MRLLHKLFEMSFNRKILIEKVSNQALPLFEHVSSIVVFNQYSDWDQTIADILNKLSELYVYKNKLSKSTTLELLYEQPVVDLEFDRYVIRLSNKKKMKPVIVNISENDFKEIYIKLVSKLFKDTLVTRDEIREIIKLKEIV